MRLENNNLKSISLVAASFTIAFLILIVFLNFADPLVTQEREFFSQDFSTTNKIFIIGSSQIGQVDNSYINNYISKYHKDYVVYNLAITGDSPQKRLESIEHIISLKPKLVVYGLGHRDLGSFIKQDDMILDPRGFFKEILSLEKIGWYDLSKLNQPRSVTMSFFKKLSDPLQGIKEDPYTPFYPQNIPSMTVIRDDIEIKTQYEGEKERLGMINQIETPDENAEVISLKKIIKKLLENDISITLVVTPHDKFHVKMVNRTHVELFDSILNSTSDEFHIKNYSLYDRYTNLDIWTLPNHVAYQNNKTLIYSEDIAKMILKEIVP